tara:strand:- start:1985 stop:2146 length:162 start_codon:yes stop_codon:yes gene_type:complete
MTTLTLSSLTKILPIIGKVKGFSRKNDTFFQFIEVLRRKGYEDSSSIIGGVFR